MLRLIKNILGKTIKFIYRMTYKLIPTHKKTVLFIAFHGRGYSDNPRAIYEYMRQQIIVLYGLLSIIKRKILLLKMLK